MKTFVIARWNRAGQPDECAPSYVFLASDDAAYMTGQVCTQWRRSDQWLSEVGRYRAVRNALFAEGGRNEGHSVPKK